MKKYNLRHILALALAIALAFALTACAQDEPAEAPAPEAPAPTDPGPAGAAQEEPAEKPPEDAEDETGSEWVLPFSSISTSPIGEDEVKKFEFSTTTLDGEEVDGSIFENAGLTMINIWGTYCGPCLMEMPDLGKIAETYGGEDFQIIGVLCDVMEGDEDMMQTAKDIVAETGADYPHLLVSESIITNMLYDVYAVPTTFFVNSQGETVCAPVIGSNSYDSWAAAIEDLISGAAGA